MSRPPTSISFRGGSAASALPILVFLAGAVALVVLGAPETEAMIVAAMAGISLGMVLARGIARYSETIFTLMTNRTATVAIVCWLWAGAFSEILRDSGLVEAIIWVGWKLDLSGAAFALGVFVSAALFAVSVGTGLGTVVGFTAVMYPAGIVLGAHPGALMGAIFSGAALGDNLAPISDTTIVSAATQETDVGGVVRSRLKYVLIAAGISAVLFLVFGGGGSAPSAVSGISTAESAGLLEETADPKGLPMLIPGVIVFAVAVGGGHFLGALTAGIAAAMLIGPLAGIFQLSDVFRVTEGGEVEGSAVRGAMALVPTAILTLLLVTAIGLMEAGGFMKRVMELLDRTVARSVRGAEVAIVMLISLANVCVSVNTVAMVTTGSLANELRRRHAIHPYRSANLLDTVSCSFPYMLPYAATITAATGIQRQVASSYEFAPVLSWSEEAPYVFYGMVLFPVMVVSVITGFGRRGEAPREGSEGGP